MQKGVEKEELPAEMLDIPPSLSEIPPISVPLHKPTQAPPAPVPLQVTLGDLRGTKLSFILFYLC